MEEENGLSLGDIFKVIFKKVWWVLGAIAVGILAVVLIIELWYNKKVELYQVSYEIVYPDSSSGKYPDGNDFLISECISSVTLEKIKDSSDDFSQVDISKMLKNDDIFVSETVERTAGDVVKHTYTMSVRASYFKNDETGIRFLRAAVEYPVERVREIVNNKEYGLFFQTFDNAKTYEEKIYALDEQKNYLTERYNILKNYDESVETEMASLRNVFTENERTSLFDRIEAYFYVFDTKTFKDDSAPRIDALDKQIRDNENIIEALRTERDRKSSEAVARAVAEESVINAYDYQIAQIIIENEKLRNEKQTIQSRLDAIEKYETAGSAENVQKKQFDDLLASYRAELETATGQLKAKSISVYGNNSTVIYSGNKVEKTGGMNALLAALIGAAIGFVLAAAVILIIDLPKFIRNKKVNAPEEALPENDAEVQSDLPESGNE